MIIVTCPGCGQQFFALDGVGGVEHPRPGDDGRHSWVWAPIAADENDDPLQDAGDR
jgi:hypothetical protein